ncbi:MAG: S9 family peptidase [Candidatus Eremiobacteraeota bacterium]|nr:S9 family peptidase [Candidatus Eremiobacteraeota bacterium]
MKMRIVAAALCAFALFPSLSARADDFTLDGVFSKEPLWGRQYADVNWAPNGKYFTYVTRSQDVLVPESLMRYDVAAGTSHPWIHVGDLGGAKETPSVVAWSPDSSKLALSAGGALWIVSVAGGKPWKIADDVDDALWSPKGDAIAYAHEGDLYDAAVTSRRATIRVTKGGVADTLLNGTLDWVYPEELSIEHGFRWSPDGTHIAYLRLDEKPVTNFPLVDFLVTDNKVNYERYPLAGEKNPRASIRVVDLATLSDRLVYDAAPHDEYVANFDWVPKSLTLETEIFDRREQHMRVDLYAKAAAPAKTIYSQSSQSWVDVQPLPRWQPDGSSVWLLDRDTTAGIYVRGRDGSLRKQSGDYRVFKIDGVLKNGSVVAEAGYPTRRDRSLISVSRTGTVTNLTPVAGGHYVTVAPTNDRFVDTRGTLNDPWETDLVTVAGLASKTLVAQNTTLKGEMLPTEMLSVPSQYGPLDAYMIKPPNFDATKKYPVVVYVYGGPDAPTTGNEFGGWNSAYEQLLARLGVIVFSVDGPASQVDSDAHVRLLLNNFGPGSLLGQEIGAKYLATLPYVDATRIGIWGWSFGGYETCYAMTHSKLFAAGAAVAPVTDWHFYDTIYTERYMGLPQHRDALWDKNSVLPAAGSLNGPLLIQHGTADDNVHMANTITLIQHFILAKEERVIFYPYPRKTHSISGLPQRRSVFAHMLNFWQSTFKP